MSCAAAILLDRLRQIQAKRVKEYGEQQRAALSTNKEVKKVTERLRAEAAEQVGSKGVCIRL